jgi:hypothetical protein
MLPCKISSYNSEMKVEQMSTLTLTIIKRNDSNTKLKRFTPVFVESVASANTVSKR